MNFFQNELENDTKHLYDTWKNNFVELKKGFLLFFFNKFQLT